MDLPHLGTAGMHQGSSEDELNRSQFVTGSQKHRDPRFPPYAFTKGCSWHHAVAQGFLDRKGFSCKTLCRLLPPSRGEAILCMPQNGFGLIASHAREPCQEIIESGTVFQILEEGLHRNACPFKNPGAAHFARNSLDRRTLIPIKHDLSLQPASGGGKRSGFELNLGQFVNRFNLGGTSYHESLTPRSRKQGASAGQGKQNYGGLHALHGCHSDRLNPLTQAAILRISLRRTGPKRETLTRIRTFDLWRARLDETIWDRFDLQGNSRCCGIRKNSMSSVVWKDADG